MRLLCLANSFRDKGRCLAGVELDTQNKPKVQNNNNIWIRPILGIINHTLPLDMVKKINIFDILEFNIIEKSPIDHQKENVIIGLNTSFLSLGSLNKDFLSLLFYENSGLVFEDSGRYIRPDDIYRLTKSIGLFMVENPCVKEISHIGKANPSKYLSFKYKSYEYLFTITDPVFLSNYEKNRNILVNVSTLSIVISVAEKPFFKNDGSGGYYKIVATIFI